MITTKIDKQQWRRDVEAMLSADERVLFNERLATMAADKMDRIDRFAPSAVADEVRFSKLRAEAKPGDVIEFAPTALTTRKEP